MDLAKAMKDIILKTKYAIEQICISIMKAFWILPIKQQYFFISYDGKQYSDSPRCISEYVHFNTPQAKILWALDNDLDEVPGYVTKVKRNSLLFYIAICSSKTIVTNNSLPSIFPKRKNQIVLNTWHGGSPTKTVGFMESNPNPYYKYYFKLQEKKTSAILSNSTFFTEEVVHKSFGYSNIKVLEFGMPKNDVFFKDHTKVRESVCRYFGIIDCENTGIVLYAPTFRGSAHNGSFLSKEEQLSIKDTTEWLSKKFHKSFIFLFRAHHAMKDIDMEGAFSATQYPDMQDLLCAADVLITDYSSCMHDFSLMKKPVFLYIPDYKEYMKDRGFYYDIPTMPFPFAFDKDGLHGVISDFSEEEYNIGVDRYLSRMNNFDDGTATDKTIKWLEEQWTKE